jgi:hypothetical protein
MEDSQQVQKNNNNTVINQFGKLNSFPYNRRKTNIWLDNKLFFIGPRDMP